MRRRRSMPGGISRRTVSNTRSRRAVKMARHQAHEHARRHGHSTGPRDRDSRCREAALCLHEPSDNASELRDGMKVDDLRVIGLLMPGLPNLKLSGEYLWQHNDDQKGRGWYAGASYTFAEAPWQPTLAYKYSEFTRGYDPLFYGTSGERVPRFKGRSSGNTRCSITNRKTAN